MMLKFWKFYGIKNLIFIPFIHCGFHFFATGTSDELSDQEDIPILPALIVKREGENNTNKGAGGRIPLTYRAQGIECKTVQMFYSKVEVNKNGFDFN